jgi:hypothetical protein
VGPIFRVCASVVIPALEGQTSNALIWPRGARKARQISGNIVPNAQHRDRNGLIGAVNFSSVAEELNLTHRDVALVCVNRKRTYQFELIGVQQLAHGTKSRKGVRVFNAPEDQSTFQIFLLVSGEICLFMSVPHRLM